MRDGPDSKIGPQKLPHSWSWFRMAASEDPEQLKMKNASPKLIEQLLSSRDLPEFLQHPPLSLPVDASAKARDAAYKKAAWVLHPDRCKDARATEAFQRLTLLYAEDHLIERLLSSPNSKEFFKQPPFSLSEHASGKMLDSAYRKAGRMIHPDRCRHSLATKAFQRLAEFHAEAPAATLLRRDRCEECGVRVDRPADLCECANCGHRACQACSSGLTDGTDGSVKKAGVDYCYVCVWLDKETAMLGPPEKSSESGAAGEAGSTPRGARYRLPTPAADIPCQ